MFIMPRTPPSVEATEPLPQWLQDARVAFESGGLVVFPTETSYGVGASALSDVGMAALHAYKDKLEESAFTIHLARPEDAGLYVDMTDAAMSRVVTKLLAAPVTLQIEVDESERITRGEAMGLTQRARDRVWYDGVVGLRCPNHELGRLVLGSIDAPVLASSAGRSGEATPRSFDAAIQAAGADAAAAIDGGPCRFSAGSTVVQVRRQSGRVSWNVRRSGVYEERYLRKLMNWSMLLVCSGNTCRSPMAEVVARQMIAERRGLHADDLEAAGVTVQSAGVFANNGTSASTEAVKAMAEVKIDLSGHRSKALNAELVQSADVIYTMTESHRQAVVDAFPGAEAKVYRLDAEADVEDPFGGTLRQYQRTAEMIRRRLEQRLTELGM